MGSHFVQLLPGGGVGMLCHDGEYAMTQIAGKGLRILKIVGETCPRTVDNLLVVAAAERAQQGCAQERDVLTLAGPHRPAALRKYRRQHMPAERPKPALTR